MKRIACSFAIVAAALAATVAPAAAEFEIQMLMQEANNAHDATRLDTAMGLAAAHKGRQKIEISCSPASSGWCAKDFVAACDRHNGGMSTNPDGSVTCSLPQHK